MDAKKWLELACNKKDKRPEMATVQGNVATDGFRLHHDKSQAPVKNDTTDRWSVFIPSRPRNRATIIKQDLIAACKRAKGCRHMVYTLTGDKKEVTFGISPRYLLDALAGMEGDTVEIDIPARTAPFYMTDGNREAVIMPIYIP